MRASRSFPPLLLALACAAAVLALWWFHTPFLELSELRAYDLRFRERGALAPSGAVALAMIDEQSLRREGRWPWPRSKLAALVDALSRDGARVIAFDIAFPEPDRNSELALLDALEGELAQRPQARAGLADFLAERRLHADHDRALAEALRRSRAAVVLGYVFHRTASELGDVSAAERARRLALIGPSRYPLVVSRGAARASFPESYAAADNLERLVRAADSLGYFSVRPDPDGNIRRMPLVMRAGGDLFPPLSVLAAWHYLDRPPLVVRTGPLGAEGIQLGDRFVPTAPDGALLVDYLGPPGTFPHFSVSDILAGAVAAGSFEGRIVVVGSSAMGMYDLRSTPVGPVYPGAEIHATLIDELLTGRLLARPAWADAYTPLAIALLCLGCGLALPRLGVAAGLALAAGLAALVYLAAREAFLRLGAWLDLVYPLLALGTTYTALMADAFVRERRRRRGVRDAFAHYVAPVVVDAMLADPARLRLGGEEKLLTVLFCDLEGFTSYAEKSEPREVFEALSEYYGLMTERIFASQGMLKEYVGDELMAIFGAPLDQPDHAARACTAALEMRDLRRVLAERWAARGRPPLRARTGINSGQMLVGNLGSEYRFSYGVLGDPVNLGSRLEGLNKVYGTEILLGENTATLAGHGFRLREVDHVRVAGKQEPTRIFELVGYASAVLPAAHEALLQHYAAALQAYREQAFDAAAAALRSGLQLWPDDGPSRALLSRCALPRAERSALDRDGVFEWVRK
jgi:adenylate cyclase